MRGSVPDDVQEVGRYTGLSQLLHGSGCVPASDRLHPGGLGLTMTMPGTNVRPVRRSP